MFTRLEKAKYDHLLPLLRLIPKDPMLYMVLEDNRPGQIFVNRFPDPYEGRLGEAFFQFHPAYRHLREEMLDHAEANLTGVSKKTGASICVPKSMTTTRNSWPWCSLALSKRPRWHPPDVPI